MSKTARANANTVPADGSRRDFLAGIARGALAGAAVAIGTDVVAQPSPAPLPRATNAVTPFRVATSSAAISDARRRLQATRWPERQTADGWRQGAPLATIQALVAYWRTAYDWRRLERRLNAYPQFRTEIDGLGIHFLHVRSPHEHARPIILTHGWPGSIVEFLNVIGSLTNPTKLGGQPDDAFHVVVPSLPGFAFSDKPVETGWDVNRIARAWATLMLRLGYDRWVAQGGDWGAGVTHALAHQRPQGLIAAHVNWQFVFPEKLPENPTPAERRAIDRASWFASMAGLSAGRIELPMAASVFPHEIFCPPKAWAEALWPNLFYWNELDKGGHFAAFEQSKVFTEELRKAFRSRRG